MTNSISRRGFRMLLLSQFAGALNDNIFRCIVSLIVVDAFSGSGEGATQLSMSEAVFLLPFILFSPFAGALADRYPKNRVMVVVKLIEVAVIAFSAIILPTKFIPGLIAALLLMGIHSTLFSPSKYGSIPELIDEEDLSKANGYLELLTFVGIIVGTAVGGILKFNAGDYFILPSVVMITIALIGLLASLRIPALPQSSDKLRLSLNPLKDVQQTLREVRGNSELTMALTGTAFFWLVGVLFKLNLLIFAKEFMVWGDLKTSLLLAIFAVGIGAGSVMAGTVSAGKVELGLVPIGAFGISLGTLLMFSFAHYYVLALFCLTLVGVGGGFFIVPLNALLQSKSPPLERGRYLATSNFICFSGMLLACGLCAFFLSALLLSPQTVFLIISLTTVVVAVVMLRMMPEVFLRCLNWLFLRVLYRIRVSGGNNIPETGGALLVSNHVSFADACILLAATKRPIRFIIYKPIYEAAIVHPVLKAVNCIPIPTADQPKAVLKALQTARDAINNGELVCIFAEGQITRVGLLLPFAKGLERIMKGVERPIIPIYLDQVWGSVFSFNDGQFFWKAPKSIPYPVSVRIGTPLVSTSRAEEVRQAVQDLSAESACERVSEQSLLHLEFLRSAKRNIRKIAVADSSGRELSYGRVVGAALRLSKVLEQRRIKDGTADQSMVGVCLPPSTSGVVVNAALLLEGKVPVNLNYTAGEATLRSALEQCSISTVITSKAFSEKLELPTFPGQIFLEDVATDLKHWSVLAYSVALAVLPLSVFRSLFVKNRQVPHDIATVIFSSGSTATPKGVLLSHHNVTSNIQSCADVFHLKRQDVILGVLPFFHSFGFMATLWLPLLNGRKAVYHNNPMDAQVIGELIKKHRATLLLSTPTFLLTYIRRCTKEQFATIRLVITGAEKLKPRVAQAFQEKFGTLPMEGYGCTELSPAVAFNLPDYERDDIRQTGNKAGTVGHPVPGVTARIVDPDTFAVLATGTAGLLLIKGPNVMLGYLGQPEKTREVIRDGWYITGDIAKIDSDGFITITDRLSRFSKIAGEMVPHMKIEEELHRVLKQTEQAVFVTAVPDEKKGERLVVLSKVDFDFVHVVKQLAETDSLPNLWIPKADSFYRIEEFPVLGSGKLDLKSLKTMALDVAGVSTNEE